MVTGCAHDSETSPSQHRPSTSVQALRIHTTPEPSDDRLQQRTRRNRMRKNRCLSYHRYHGNLSVAVCRHHMRTMRRSSKVGMSMVARGRPSYGHHFVASSVRTQVVHFLLATGVARTRAPDYQVGVKPGNFQGWPSTAPQPRREIQRLVLGIHRWQ